MSAAPPPPPGSSPGHTPGPPSGPPTGPPATPTSQLLEPRVVRSGVSNLFRWMGLGLIVVGVLVGAGGAVAGLVIGDLSMLAMLILTVVFGGAGLLMHLAGRRSKVTIDANGLTWSSPLGQPRTVPWAEIHHVEVPEDPWTGRTVLLVLHTGVRLPVNAIRMSSTDRRTYADNGYLSAGAEIVAAHQAWLASAPR